ERTGDLLLQPEAHTVLAVRSSSATCRHKALPRRDPHDSMRRRAAVARPVLRDHAPLLASGYPQSIVAWDLALSAGLPHPPPPLDISCRTLPGGRRRLEALRTEVHSV